MATTNSYPEISNCDRSALLNVPLLAAMSESARDSLLSCATVSSVAPRTNLVQEGDPVDAIFCVLDGYVRLYRLSREGREADIRICGAGDTFGECLLFAQDGYRYNAQATEVVRVARFNGRIVRDLVQQDPRFAALLLSSVSGHLLETIDRITNDRLFTAPQKLANYLIDRCPAEGGPASFRLPFQKNLLAGMLGLAPEALSRAFSSLRSAGVTVRGRVVQIGDVEALRNI